MALLASPRRFFETRGDELSADLLLRPSPPLSARVGLLGCGVVGSSVARLLLSEGRLARVAVLRPKLERPVELPPSLLGDAFAVVEDPSVDVVVELIGGTELPRELIGRALANGKSVVTANKEVLARHGRELSLAAATAGVDLLFEGAVGAGIPILSALRERLAWEEVRRIAGVVNGTTNFVLELMAEGMSQPDAVAHAQSLGYAEADPAADLDGRDAASKLAILIGLASGGWVTADDVERTGIESVSRADLGGAAALGFAVKLVAEATPSLLRVGPALVPRASSLGRLRGVENEVVLDCSVSGRLAFRGPGAGGEVTAGAVVGDVEVATRNLRAGTRSPLVTRERARPASLPHPERWFVRAADGPAAAARLESAGLVVERHVSFPFADDVHTAFVIAPTARAVVEELNIPALPIQEV